MSLILAPQPNLTTGDESNNIGFTATIGYTGSVPTQPIVKSAIITRDRTQVLITPVVCAVTSFTTTATVATIVGKVNFSALNTRKLLADETNLGSALLKTITKVLDDETGYATALLEIQVGAPFNQSRHAIITVAKGLIE